MGKAGNYRAGKTNLRAELIKQAFLEQVARDIRSEGSVRSRADQARRAQQPTDGIETSDLSKQVKEVGNKIGRVMSAIEKTDTPGPLLRRISELESQREEIIDKLDRLEEETRQAKALSAVKESDVRRMVDALAEDMAALDRQHLKDFLRGMIQSLTLDPATRTGEIRYRIESGVKVASPRGFEPLYSP